MKESSHLNYGIRSVMALVLGCMGLAGILLADVFYLRVSFLQEGLPRLSYAWLLRSTVIFFSLLAITFGITRRWGLQALLPSTSSFCMQRLMVLGTLIIGSLFLLVFQIKPAVFSAMSQENYPIEAASAILLLCSCVASAAAAFRAYGQTRVSMVTASALVALSFVFFLIAMEEISWGQHILGLETPDAFSANQQHELNFHNFATNAVENAYYFGAFLFLVVLPFLTVLFPTTASKNALAPLLPRPFIIPIGALISAYNFDMWNILLIQVSFFGSLAVLSLLFVLSTDNQEKRIVALTLILLILTQVIFLTNGDSFSRLWEVTEYKEFLISLAFFAYSITLYRELPRSLASANLQRLSIE